MSCLIMEPEPLAALANAVETLLNCGYNYWGFEAPDSLFLELQDCKRSRTYFVGPIYRRLHAVNARAWNGRYADHEKPASEDAPPVDVDRYVVHRGPRYREHGFAVRPWHYRLAKLLDFWLYQTAEDETYKDPLRLAMRDFRDALYGFIVRNDPRYVEARWGGLPMPARISPARKPARRRPVHCASHGTFRPRRTAVPSPRGGPRAQGTVRR